MSIIKSILLFLFTIFLSSCSKNVNTYQGYVEGDFAYIAAPFSGILQKMPISKGMQVNAGQLLLVLEKEPESSALKQMHAKVVQTQAQKKSQEANLALAEMLFKRRQKLYAHGSIQLESLDNARTELELAKAGYQKAQAAVEAAQAELQQAQWASEQKRITAPNQALVFDTYYLPGEFIAAGRPMLSLLASNDIKIIFFVADTQLNEIKLGQQIQIQCDNCHESMRASIKFISPQAEYTPPVIFSNETKGKLVYRVEAVPIEIDPTRLHPGQPVTIQLM